MREWPPGSGREAWYEPSEERLMVRVVEAGGAREAQILHDLKVLLDAVVVPQEEP